MLVVPFDFRFAISQNAICPDIMAAAIFLIFKECDVSAEVDIYDTPKTDWAECRFFRKTRKPQTQTGTRIWHLSSFSPLATHHQQSKKSIPSSTCRGSKIPVTCIFHFRLEWRILNKKSTPEKSGEAMTATTQHLKKTPQEIVVAGMIACSK